MTDQTTLPSARPRLIGDESPPEYHTLHRRLVKMCAFCFVMQMILCTALFPFLILRYGWWG